MTSPGMNSYWIYEGLRKIFLLGLRVRPILEALDLKPGEKFLDAGCGYGFFSKYCANCDYTGVDVDSRRIQWAQKKMGESSHRRFVTAQVTQTGFPPKSFDKVLGYGLLHHLSDEDAKKTAAELARLAKNAAVFSEPVYSKCHWINNLLCKMDQGSYVRTRENYLKIFEADFIIRTERFFYARNGLAKYLLIVATPKKAL